MICNCVKSSDLIIPDLTLLLLSSIWAHSCSTFTCMSQDTCILFHSSWAASSCFCTQVHVLWERPLRVTLVKTTLITVSVSSPSLFFTFEGIKLRLKDRHTAPTFGSLWYLLKQHRLSMSAILSPSQKQSWMGLCVSDYKKKSRFNSLCATVAHCASACVRRNGGRGREKENMLIDWCRLLVWERWLETRVTEQLPPVARQQQDPFI